MSPRGRGARTPWPAVAGRSLIGWVAAVLGLAVLGALGYMLLEGWSFLDGLYMAVTTMTTVGFREVHELDWPGRIWTMLMALSAIGIIFGTVGVVAENIMNDVASGRRRAKRMSRVISQLKGHYVVCGYGRVGSMVARELRDDGHVVVVIDVGEESLKRAEDDDYLVIHGDGASEEVLRRAGVERAIGLVSVIDSDAHNVYVTLTARSLNPTLFIVGRAGDQTVIPKLIQAGADRAVSPYTMAGRRIVNLTLRPGVIEFIDAALTRSSLAFTMEEVRADAGGPLDGHTVGELRTRGILTLAVLHAPGQYEANPPDDRQVLAGEHLIVSGATEVLDELVRAGSDSARSWQPGTGG
ncbi:MAG TPA: potassium channel protein [Propionicimonas sp.]|nr:potassium channel protein [Propionicimonas sp.]